MIESHVAGLTGLRLSGFPDREQVSRMTCIAGGKPEARSLGLEPLNLWLGLNPDLMTTPTALHAFHQRHGLPVGSGHGLHGSPCQRVFACLELSSLYFVTRPASVSGRYLCLGNVSIRDMFIAMAYIARYLILAMRAQLPVRSDVGRD